MVGSKSGPGVRFHVLYWEGSDERGIRFGRYDFVRGNGPRREATFCATCKGIADPFRNRVDNMQSSLRMCVDPGGQRFREEIADFVCLSPRSRIVFDLQTFQRYNARRGMPWLTEETVLGAAISGFRGDVEPRASGVDFCEFSTRNTEEAWPPGAWLRDYLRGIQQSAEAAAGVAAGLMLDKNGIEVSSFGVASSAFARERKDPVREVVIVLGGPGGIEDAALSPIMRAFDEGLHVGTVPVRLPGGLQHSYVALGDLLSCHDRGHLLPVLEDCRFLTGPAYRRWYNTMKWFMSTLAALRQSPAEKRETVRRFIERLQSSSGQGGSDGEAARAADGDDAVAGDGVALASSEGALHDDATGTGKEEKGTPLDVDRRLVEMETHGLLPRRRPLRARLCVQALEPRRLLAVLRRFERQLQTAITAGCPLPDPWTELARQLDKALAVAAPAADSTEHDLLRTLVDALAKADPGVELSSLREEKHRLRALPCEVAIGLVRELVQRGSRWPERLASAIAVCEAEQGGAAPLQPKPPSRPPPQALLAQGANAGGVAAPPIGMAQPMGAALTIGQAQPRQPSKPPPALLLSQQAKRLKTA